MILNLKEAREEANAAKIGGILFSTGKGGYRLVRMGFAETLGPCRKMLLGE